MGGLFPDYEGNYLIHWHFSNESEDERGVPRHPIWRHGRGWLHLSRHCLNAEWVFPSSRLHLEMELEADEDVLSFVACVPPVGLYFGLDSWPLGRRLSEWLKAGGVKDAWNWKREITVSVHDWGVYWGLWSHPHEWRSGDRNQGAWHPFGHPGSRVGEPEVLETRDVEVPMPERTYRGRATKTRSTHQHPLFPLLRQRSTHISIDMLPGEGVPVPGKGENSWDCDEDALLGGGFGGETFEQAIGNMVGSALRRRRAYGGANWRPASKAAPSP